MADKLNLALAIKITETDKSFLSAYDSLLDKARHYMEIVRFSEHQDSVQEWEYLKHLYTKLINIPKLSESHKSILSLLEPFIIKFHDGEHNPEHSLQLDHTKMFRVDPIEFDEYGERIRPCSGEE